MLCDVIMQIVQGVKNNLTHGTFQGNGIFGLEGVLTSAAPANFVLQSHFDMRSGSSHIAVNSSAPRTLIGDNRFEVRGHESVVAGL